MGSEFTAFPDRSNPVRLAEEEPNSRNSREEREYDHAVAKKRAGLGFWWLAHNTVKYYIFSSYAVASCL